MSFEFPLYIALIPAAIAAAIVLLGLFLFININKVLGLLIGAFGIHQAPEHARHRGRPFAPLMAVATA